jgi:hypothetical protein
MQSDALAPQGTAIAPADQRKAPAPNGLKDPNGDPLAQGKATLGDPLASSGPKVLPPAGPGGPQAGAPAKKGFFSSMFDRASSFINKTLGPSTARPPGGPAPTQAGNTESPNRQTDAGPSKHQANNGPSNRRADTKAQAEANTDATFFNQRDNKTTYDASADNLEKIRVANKANSLAEWKVVDSKSGKLEKWIKVQKKYTEKIDEKLKTEKKLLDEEQKDKDNPATNDKQREAHKKRADARAVKKADIEVARGFAPLFGAAEPSMEAVEAAFTLDHPNGLLSSYDDVTHHKDGSSTVKVASRMCNITSTAMAIADVMGSTQRAKRVAADLISERLNKPEFAGMEDEALKQYQLADLLDMLITGLWAGDEGAASHIRESHEYLGKVVKLFKEHKAVDGTHDTTVGDSASVVAPSTKGSKGPWTDPKKAFFEPLQDWQGNNFSLFGKGPKSIAEAAAQGHSFVLGCHTPGGGHYVTLHKVEGEGVSIMDPYCANLFGKEDGAKLANENGTYLRQENAKIMRAAVKAGDVSGVLKRRFKNNPKALAVAEQLAADAVALPEAKAAQESLSAEAKQAESAMKKAKAPKGKSDPALQTAHDEAVNKNADVKARLTTATEKVKRLESPTPDQDGSLPAVGFGEKVFYDWTECTGVQLPNSVLGIEKLADPKAKDEAEKEAKNKGKKPAPNKVAPKK